jgi:hypothetical protein
MVEGYTAAMLHSLPGKALTMLSCVKSVGVGISTVLLFCILPNVAAAQVDPPEVLAKPAPGVIAILPAKLGDELADRLKEALVRSLPPELVLESRHNWGHQAEVPSIQGVKLIHVLRNHGDWEMARVVTRKLAKHLTVHIGELYSPAENRAVFTIHVTTPATVDLRSQTWQNGIQVFTSSVRAHFHLEADLTVEAALTPAAILDLKGAAFSSRGFVAENVNGLGGDFARYSSGLAQRSFKPWQPTILAEFQKSIIAALQSAGETAELRAGLDKMMRQSMAARVQQLEARTAGGALVALPRDAFVPQMVEVPCVAGSVSIEIPISTRVSPPHRDLSPAFARAFEHLGFVEHSVRFVGQAAVHVIAAVASSHASEHKK